MARNHARTDGYLLPNSTTYIVACSAAEARLFVSERRFGNWQALETMNNPGGSLREQAFNSDRPGRAFDRFGKGRHAISPEETAHQHELQAFAHDIAQHLSKAHSAGRFKRLVLIAEPTFLGYMRRKLPAPLKRVLCCEVPKNPTEFNQQRLQAIFT